MLNVNWLFLSALLNLCRPYPVCQNVKHNTLILCWFTQAASALRACQCQWQTESHTLHLLSLLSPPLFMCHHILPLLLPLVLLDLPTGHSLHLNKSHLSQPTASSTIPLRLLSCSTCILSPSPLSLLSPNFVWKKCTWGQSPETPHLASDRLLGMAVLPGWWGLWGGNKKLSDL